MNDTDEDTLIASRRGKMHDTSRIGPPLVKKKVRNNKLRQSMKIHSISNNYYNANGNPRNYRVSHDFESLPLTRTC